MIRVLIVDDSALVRRLLREILHQDPEIEVVGHAADPYIARQKIKQLDPDVITLDVEMPRMDGISFLKNLMRLRPMPVVMVSSQTAHGAQVTLDALAIGAVDFVCKPASDLAETLPAYAEEIISKVKAAAAARVRPGRRRRPRRRRAGTTSASGIEVIAMGASTGGTEAIREVLEDLPVTCPPVVIVQHIPFPFSTAFAERLNSVSALQVGEARHQEPLAPGRAYVAPGNRHLSISHRGSRIVCELSDGERVNQHRPAVDVLFESVAREAGEAGVGVLLTGMGSDGAMGMAALRSAGASTVAQDEQSSVVWGMPREAILLGVVDHVVPLAEVSAVLMRLIETTDAIADS